MTVAAGVPSSHVKVIAERIALLHRTRRSVIEVSQMEGFMQACQI